MSHESYENAKLRYEEKLRTGTTKKSPVGKFENMDWDKKALMEEVSGYNDDGVVNWSELARKYEVKNKNGELAKNGGQIVQEYLKSQSVDVLRFRKRGADDGGRIRKRMKRSAGGEITVPCPMTNKELKNKLQQKILSGEYNIGELIVPRQVSLAISLLIYQNMLINY